MISEEFMALFVRGALAAMIIALPVTGWRLQKADNDSDRLLVVDMVTTLLVGIVVLLAVVENTNTTIDMGIALAALSFAGTLTVARYISEKKVF